MSQSPLQAKPTLSPVATPEHLSVAHWMRANRARAFQLYILIAVVAFAVLTVFVSTTPYFGFDLTFEHYVQSLQSAPMDTIMQLISDPGFAPQSFVITGVIVLFLFITGWRWEAGMALGAALGVTLLGILIKLFIQRARPTPELVHVFAPLKDYSFPSGHVLFYTAFFGFLWFLIYTHAPHSLWRTFGLYLFGALVATIGISRIYLGQHWPSDVLGAYLLGSLWLALIIFAYRRFRTPSGTTPLQTAPSAAEAGSASGKPDSGTKPQ